MSSGTEFTTLLGRGRKQRVGQVEEVGDGRGSGVVLPLTPRHARLLVGSAGAGWQSATACWANGCSGPDGPVSSFKPVPRPPNRLLPGSLPAHWMSWADPDDRGQAEGTVRGSGSRHHDRGVGGCGHRLRVAQGGSAQADDPRFHQESSAGLGRCVRSPGGDHQAGAATFHARFELQHRDRVVHVDCRLSDGIALAIRHSVPIIAADELEPLLAAA